MKATIEFDDEAQYELREIIEDILEHSNSVSAITSNYEEFVNEKIEQLFKQFVKNMNIYNLIEHKIALTNKEYLDNARKAVDTILKEKGMI